MKRKLMLLNVVLLALLVAGGLELHRRIEQASSRYEILQRMGAPKEPPAYPAPQSPPRLRQADYLAVVNRLLFYQDRNAIVEVEAPVEKVVQRPALPILIGVMNLGDGPIALMAATSKSSPRPVGIGGTVGEYTFLGLSGDKLKLSWQGEQIEVDQDKLAGEVDTRSHSDSRSSAASKGSRSAAARRSAAGGRQTRQPETKNAAAENRKGIGGRYSIGAEFRPGVFHADSADNSPDGTEAEGYRKVVRQTPFGSQSWWVKKDAQQQQPQQ